MTQATRTCCVALVLMLASMSRAALAQDRFPLFTTDSMRLACAYADSEPNAGARIRAYCAAELANGWNATIPTLEEARMAANRQPGPPVLAGAALPSLAIVGTTSLPSQATLILGFTDFVVNRAKEESRTFLINGFIEPLCSEAVIAKDLAKGMAVEVTIKSFLPSTCELLTTGATKSLKEQGFVLPSWSVVQTSLRRDADTLPEIVVGRVTEFAAARYAGKLTDSTIRTTAERVVVLAGSARLGLTYVSRREIPRAFRESAIAMSRMMDQLCVAAAPPATNAPPPTTTGGPPGGPGGPGGLGNPTVTAPASECQDWTKLKTTKAILSTAAAIGSASSSDLTAVFGNSATARDSAIKYIVKTILVNGRGKLDRKEPFLRAALADLTREFGAGVTQSQVNALDLAARVQTTVAPFRDVVADVEAHTREANGDRSKIVLAYAQGVRDLAEALRTALRDNDASATIDTRRLDSALALVAHVATIPSLRATANYAGLLAELMTLTSAITDLAHRSDLDAFTLPPKAAKALQFAVDASQTKDADAFAATLEHYAAPANGFLRKRTPTPDGFGIYWSLNAYVGAALGREWTKGRNVIPERGEGFATYSGLFIPVGVEIGTKNTTIGAAALLFQLIDVGQVASWRSNQDSVSAVETTPPGLTLASIFAPGVNLVINVPKYPLALGGGLAYAPQFRALSKTSITSEPKASVMRWTLFAAIDVPLFP